MPTNQDFQPVYDALREVMIPYAKQLVLVADEGGRTYLDTEFMMKNKKPMNFGMVEIKKSYVSYHLMPLYVFPELLDNASQELKRRMQGKQCFNFKRVDEGLFNELSELTKKGFEAYQKAGYVSEQA